MAGVALGAARPAAAQRAEALSGPLGIEVAAKPIAAFQPGAPERRRFGELTFRSGLVLTSTFKGFGGFSGLARGPDGSLLGLTDAAQWLTARPIRREGALVGLGDCVMAPLLAANGRPLRRTRAYDTEGLTLTNGVAYVASERSQEVSRFEFGREGVAARARPVPVPPEAKALPPNQGLEAIGVAPARHPLAGAVVVVAERAAGGEDAPTLGFILTGPRRGSFEVARAHNFDITDLAFLPDGDMLLLERRFSLLGGLAVRLRRIPAKALAPGALLDGPVVLEAAGGFEIDNMEGLAVHEEAGQTVVSMISDDNFSLLQRTLLLEFSLG